MDAFAAGQSAWPDISLAADTFDAYLSARGLSRAAENGADLFLACACLHQIPSALRAFETAQLAQMPRFLSRLRPSPPFVDEVRQLLRDRLFVGPTPRIADYSGKGSLGAWLRVVSVRLAIDVMRAQSGAVDPGSDSSLPDAASSPEVRALRNRYRPHFRAALAEALETLPSDQRALLRLHYVDGLNMEALGRLFKVNRSTILRRLGVCTRALLDHMRERLGAELGVTTGELQSLAGLLTSDLELSLGEHLKSRS